MFLSHSMMATTSRMFFNSSKHELSIGHLNVCSLNPQNSKFAEIHDFLINCKFNIIGITETWLTESISSKAVALNGYSFERCDRAIRRAGGVGLYISKELNYKVICSQSYHVTNRNCYEILIVEISSGCSKMAVGVLYLPPDNNISNVEDLISNFSQMYGEFVLMGDLNCNILNPRESADIFSICHRNNLHVVHNNIPTHYDIFHGSSSLLDIFLVSQLDKVVASKQCLTPASISKHSLIGLHYNFVGRGKSPLVSFRNLKNINQDRLLMTAYGMDFSLILQLNSVDEMVLVLNEFVMSLLNMFAPMKSRRPNYKSKFPFMSSPEIIHAKRSRDLAFDAYRSDVAKSNDKWRFYCKLRNKVSKLIKRKKAEYSEQFFQSNDSKVLWNKLKSVGVGKGAKKEVPLDLDINSLNKHFCDLPDSRVFVPSYSSIPDTDGDVAFRNIDIGELENYINMVKSNAAGDDGIPIIFIKMLFPVIGPYLLHLFNFILTSSTFPNSWKIAIVNPIPKKNNPSSFGDYRSVSILPALSKVCEIVIREQIFETLPIDDMLYKHQSGFRKFCNTTTAVLDLTEEIRQSVEDKLCTCLFLFDLSRAFDMIDHNILLFKLKTKFKFSAVACKLIRSYLVDRKQRIVCNGILSNECKLTKGVPQGSILGPLFFSLFINDLPGFLKMFKVRMFADDIQAVGCCKFDDLARFCDDVNEDLSALCNYCINNGLTLNEKKTQVIQFLNTIPNALLDNKFTLNGYRLRLVDSAKCLGFMIDRELSWREHINNVVRKVNFRIRSLYQCSLNPPLQVRKKLANALLMSHIMYGLEIFSGAAVTLMNKLRVSFNNIIRFIYKIPWREHVSAFVVDFLGCTFMKFIESRCLVLLYRTLYLKKPGYLLEHFRFSTSLRRQDLLVPLHRTNIMKKSFRVRAAILWNTYVPQRLRSCVRSINVFKRMVKELDYRVNAYGIGSSASRNGYGID